MFQVSLVSLYHQTREEKFPSRNQVHTPQEIVEVETSCVPVRKIIKDREIRLNGKYNRQCLIMFKHQTADKEKLLVQYGIPEGDLHLGEFRASRKG
ncbi:hypothetical protein O181_001526 [Austropuccinia psidii MF-1]|uniref:Uncharacterized protein n=1 Tax=Austropuccinia psidii MF-1 TaxID=1389203 RepID=A0A9Q3BB57_9BASI|nr:hypothetical protein [Austropuccinia psidii MF-1]